MKVGFREDKLGRNKSWMAADAVALAFCLTPSSLQTDLKFILIPPIKLLAELIIIATNRLIANPILLVD